MTKDNLVERLQRPKYWFCCGNDDHEGPSSAPFEAATRIETLTAALLEAGEALEGAQVPRRTEVERCVCINRALGIIDAALETIRHTTSHGERHGE